MPPAPKLTSIPAQEPARRAPTPALRTLPVDEPTTSERSRPPCSTTKATARESANHTNVESAAYGSCSGMSTFARLASTPAGGIGWSGVPTSTVSPPSARMGPLVAGLRRA
jgi:hypothetical protein